jgi:uncharacterized protein (TIGR02302 family)
MSDRPDADGGTERSAALMQRLGRRRLQARAVLLFELVWPALWPALGVLGAFVCVALLDVPRMLPAVVHVAALAAATALFGWLLLRGLRRVRIPDAAEADRRLERASGLRHRPLSVLTDRPALPGADALWSAHFARAAAQVGRLRVGLPRPGLAARDMRALRCGLVVALAACLGIAGAEAPSRLLRGVVPGFAPPAQAGATELQAWITPPGYTNMAPVFLRPDGGAVSVPAGSHLTVSLSGGSGEPALTLAGRRLAFARLDAASYQADQDLTAGGRLVVHRNGADIAGWDVTVLADAAPVVQWPEPPGAAHGDSRIPQTRLPWQVSHDYGVVALQAELRLRDRPDAPALVVPIPLPGGAPKAAKGARVQDLTSHPWAGLPVVGRLVARDQPGLTGTSGEAGFTLPERRFDNPAARALMAVRRMLSAKPDDRQAALVGLEAIAEMDRIWQNDTGGYLNLRAIGAELAYARDAGVVDGAQSRMWQLALHLEEGGTDRTLKALNEARQALRDALDAQKRGEKVDPAEIEKRIQALEDAIQQHLDALAEQLRRDPDAQMNDPQAQKLNAQDAQKLAEQLREAEKQGNQQDAQQKLAELEKMLDQLEKARPMHRDAQQRERQQKRQRGEQQMSALQDLVKREGGLLDHAQARDAAPQHLGQPFGQTQTGDPTQAVQPPGDQPAAADPAQAERGTDQRVQLALRRALGELMQQFGDLTGKIPPNLGDADTAMHDAGQALGHGQDSAAATAAQKAIEALQKGGQSMSEQMSQQFGSPGDQQGDEDGQQDAPGVAMGNPEDGQDQDGGGADRPWQGSKSFGKRGDQRDPLGRKLKDGGNGSDEAADLALPDQMEQARTRAIQEELRRRGADRSRPQPELDYIDRLLKQF